MTLSWNEIRSRAIALAAEYKDAVKENAETQSFYNDFFNVFGVSRRRVATFEEPAKKLGNKHGRIDLLWKGMLLVEHKSAGRDLTSAFAQALDYFPSLKEEELPRYVLTSDFQRFELYDLETKETHRFTLADLHKNIELFGFIAGYQKREFKDQDPVNIQASERMGVLHDMLKDAGYTGHDLELFLVRLLFCLFADDTGIFEKDDLRYFLEERTKPDGSDLGARLIHLFQILNTPLEKRQKTLDEALARFPYINGNLFAESLSFPDFNSAMRAELIRACYFNWGAISPAVFGSLFQSVMDKERRRGIGAHYTTEKNIMKIIKPLFLDGLRAEFESIKGKRTELQRFHDRLSRLTFLDPACGCGNFLILAYRELRLLEIDVLKALYPTGQLALDVEQFSKINVDAFCGIEIEEFPARIAEVALWLMDHQMNMLLSETFGQYYVRIPLKAGAHIHNANALALDWSDVISPERLSYILGNPPFVGSKYQSAEQRAEVAVVFKGVAGAGVLDYVAAWYLKAARYIQGTAIVCAFVSTNSITQGEQVSILWHELFRNYHIKIHFAHRTFAWSSEARGKAAVHCVIVGFGAFDARRKQLYEYDNPKSESHEIVVANITPYLTDGVDMVIPSRNTPICDVPPIGIGNKPIDGGNYLFTSEEKDAFIRIEPTAVPYFKRWIGADEFLNGYERWCLWLGDCPPNILRAMPESLKRVDAVRSFRMLSKSAPTQKIAATPTRFHVENIPHEEYLVVPKVSSERREYIPIGFITPDTFSSDLLFIIRNVSLYHFGILSSSMHMAWVRAVCGRLKSDYRYSKDIVYNNFPWPQPNETQMAMIEAAAQAVLDARRLFPESTLADLYDPLTMPAQLLKAHQMLDRAVEKAYRPQPFASDRARVEFLFSRYEALTAPLVALERDKRKRT